MFIEVGFSMYEKECVKCGDDYQEIFVQQVWEIMECCVVGLKLLVWVVVVFEVGVKKLNEEE